MQTLNVAVPDFFKGQEVLLKSVSMADWKTYFTFHLLHAQAAILPTKFSLENFAFYGKYLTGEKEQRRAGNAASPPPMAILAKPSARPMSSRPSAPRANSAPSTWCTTSNGHGPGHADK